MGEGGAGFGGFSQQQAEDLFNNFFGKNGRVKPLFPILCRCGWLGVSCSQVAVDAAGALSEAALAPLDSWEARTRKLHLGIMRVAAVSCCTAFGSTDSGSLTCCSEVPNAAMTFRPP